MTTSVGVSPGPGTPAPAVRRAWWRPRLDGATTPARLRLLLALLILVSASGWLATTDRYWGVEWVQDLHHVLADALVVLALLHVCGVVYSSLRHRENLVAAMVSGRKRPPAAGDVFE